ncbi:hypothetical protein AQJ58_21470 [Streptomyces sp. DSM 15324]|nr:hypothetical protein AQJ58_21470 [Streptomyces sp. DSM 15324]
MPHRATCAARAARTRATRERTVPTGQSPTRAASSQGAQDDPVVEAGRPARLGWLHSGPPVRQVREAGAGRGAAVAVHHRPASDRRQPDPKPSTTPRTVQRAQRPQEDVLRQVVHRLRGGARMGDVAQHVAVQRPHELPHGPDAPFRAARARAVEVSSVRSSW